MSATPEAESVPATHSKQRFDESRRLSERAQTLIPGASHTYAKGSDQFPDHMPGIMQRGLGCHVWDVDGNEFIEFGMDQFEIDISAQYRFKSRHFWPVARQVQPLMAHIVLPRVQVKSQQFANAEAQMRMSVGIDGKPVDQRAALTNDALDRRADLSAQQG